MKYIMILLGALFAVMLAAYVTLKMEYNKQSTEKEVVQKTRIVV
ncbi:MAG: hypothetical protein P8L72_03115 [Flavobacteriaceae bacterium]|nr:hypothetical protein [Flavobacteriaceae bacterium]